MPFNEDILSDLPSPHEAEPESLRRDILDELKDHLESADRRESLKTSDPEEVERNVLKRFGNPRKIARKLWFDAMKEKLMLQKITLGLVSLVAIASLAACGLMFALARDFQSASTELLSQSREANAELLKQLTAIANREPAGPSLMEWVPLKIQIVKNDEAQTPAEGCEVTLIGPAIIETQSVTLMEETDASGIADFGLVRPGSYSSMIQTPWRFGQNRSLVVKPGSPHVEKVIAPEGPPAEHAVKPAVQWPEELKGEDVAVLFGFQRNDKTEVAGRDWQPVVGGQQYLLVRPDGRFAVYSEVSYTESNNNIRGQVQVVEHGLAVFQSNPEIFEMTLPWRGESIRILSLRVVKLARDASFPERGSSLVGLSESSLIRDFVPYGRSDVFEALVAENVLRLITEDDIQKWTIRLSQADVWVTRAMLVIEEVSETPPDILVNVVQSFFHYHDKDRDLEISEKEAGDEDLRDGQFPVSFRTFVKTSVERFLRDRENKS